MNDYLKQAEQDYHTNRFREAADGYTKVIAVEPGNMDAYDGLIHSLRELKQYDQVLAVCLRGLEIDPQNAKLNGDLGYAYMDLGRLSESETQFRRAVLLDPKLFQAPYGLACALMLQRQFQEAETPLQEAIKLDPDNIKVLSVLRLLYLQNRKLSEAVIVARRIQSLAPGLGSLFDYVDTFVVGHKLLVICVLITIVCTAMLLLSPVSWLAVGIVITICVWNGVRLIRRGQPRKAVVDAVLGIVLLGFYVFWHAILHLT
jgi:tetratricopeptide (TPR) repeat protein